MICPRCEKELPESKFWDPKARVLRKSCAACRWLAKTHSARRLGASARRKKEAQDADRWWKEQAARHP